MDSNLLRAEELGIRLEIVEGLPVWEASPVIRHQMAIDRIRESIKKTDKGCDCFHVSDIYIQFPDGSLKRPDISIFCKEPSESDDAVTQVPDAVIEIISKGYEKKDMQVGIPFYRASGIKDVVVFNPYSMEVVHFRGDEALKSVSPTQIDLECGCSCEI